MAMEKSCICSDLPSYNEIIIDQQNGFIAKSTEDYIAIISKLFDDDELKSRAAQNSRKTIINQFSIDKMVDQSVVYYQELIDTAL
jgi:glycosyltransferase involved in cell wall biosynthesis